MAKVDENNAVLPPVRLPAALLAKAKATASRRDETLSQVIRRAIRAYVGSTPAVAQTDLEDAIADTRRPSTAARARVAAV